MIKKKPPPLALSYCPAAAAGECVRVRPSMYVRLVDFNMSELPDPPVETETSVQMPHDGSIWALVSLGSVLSAIQDT